MHYNFCWNDWLTSRTSAFRKRNTTSPPLPTHDTWHKAKCYGQGRSQPQSPGWARVPLSSFFPEISINFSYFSSNFTFFLPHFGPPGGRVAHPGRPWLRHWLWRLKTVKGHPRETARRLHVGTMCIKVFICLFLFDLSLYRVVPSVQEHCYPRKPCMSMKSLIELYRFIIKYKYVCNYHKSRRENGCNR